MVVQKFNPQAVLNKLNEIEALFPVNDWQVNGLRVWPVLRTSLAYSQNQNPNMSRKKGGPQSSRKRLFTYLKIVLKLPYEYLSLKRKLKESTHIFCGASTHRVNLDGKFFNKFFDVAVSDLERQHESSVIFETTTQLHKERYPYPDRVFGLPAFYILHEILRKVLPGRKKITVQLPEYDKFFDYALKNFEHAGPIRKAFNQKDVTRRVITLYERKEFARSILKDSGVKRAYFVCYYSSLMYPMIAACNELGIATADIQHGGQGHGHYCYDGWSKAPTGGYMLLPKYFWSWDTNSAAVINAWTGRTGFHRAVAAGNPWTDVSMRLYKTPPPYTNHMLVCLTEVVLEEYLIGAIRHFGAGRTWVLRMHPRTYQHVDVLQQRIDQEGLRDYVIIENPTEVPLPVSIRYCRGMLSKPSGSVIEAVEMGLTPVLLRSTILNYYAHYIQDQKVILLEEETSECLIRILEDPSWQHGGQAVRTAQEDKFHTFERLTAIPA